MADFVRGAAGFEREPAGTVRISAPPGFAEHYLPQMIVKLRQQHPAIRIELEGSIGYADLTRREADIALRAFRPQHGDLVAVKVGSARDCILGAPEYIAELGRLKNLNDARWIQWDRDLAHFSSARWLEQQVEPDAIWLRTSRIGAQLNAAQRGLGLWVTTELYERDRGLQQVPLTASLRQSLSPLPQHELWLVGHRALRRVPRVAAVWDSLLDQIRQYAASQ